MTPDIVNHRIPFFVSYAPGGANVLAAFLRTHHLETRALFLVEGPALKIFSPYLQTTNTRTVDAIASLDPERHVIIASLSGNHNLERDVIARANARGIPTIGVLEHWGNYRKRFLGPDHWNDTSDEHLVYPDTIWVLDPYAREIALKEKLPENRIVQIDNPYMAEILGDIQAAAPPSRPQTILYISEYLDVLHPARRPEDVPPGQISEFHILSDIISTFREAVRRHPDWRLVIRLHPNEPRDKYNHLVIDHPAIHVSPADQTLVHDIANAKAIIGIHSVAMAVAAEAQKPVYAYDLGKRPLPHSTIVYATNAKKIFDQMECLA